MSEEELIERTPEPATISSLSKDLKGLGIREGETLLVGHESNTSFHLAEYRAEWPSKTLPMRSHAGEDTAAVFSRLGFTSELGGASLSRPRRAGPS